MRKWKTVLAIALTVVLLIAGCGENKTDEWRDFDGNITVHVSMGEDDPRTAGAKRFARLAEEYTDGRVRVALQAHNGSISDRDLIEGMIADDADVSGCVVSGAYLSDYTDVGAMEISILPYLLTDYETAWSYLDSDLLTEFEEGLFRYNMHTLTHYCGSFRCMTNSKRPIVTADDLKGLVIRTPSGSVVMDMLFYLDAKALPLPFSELNDALEREIFDGQENSSAVIYHNGLYEHQKYLSVTNHAYMAYNLMIAESVWQQLSTEDQDALMRAAEESAQFQRPLSREEAKDCIEKIRASGVQVNYPDLESFKEATESLRQEKAEKYPDDYARVKEWLEGRFNEDTEKGENDGGTENAE